MKRVFGLAMGLAILALTGSVGAEEKGDNTKKIVAVWEVTKSGSEIPAGSTVEFTKDSKIVVQIKDDNKTKIEGTYTVDKDKLNVKLKVGDMTLEETLTIQKLTENALELKDKDGKVDELKKKTS